MAGHGADGPAGRGAAFWLGTWFGAGLLPVAPATWGSLAALPLAALLSWSGGPVLVLAVIAPLAAAGWWAAETHIRAVDRHDPREFVVDEVCGQCLALAFVPVNAWLYLLGFLVFRAVDILKPWPCNWIDRRVAGGAGVMGDDLLAGVYSGAIMLGLASVLR